MSWLNRSAPIIRDLISTVNNSNLFSLSYESTIEFISEFLEDHSYRDINSIVLKSRIYHRLGKIQSNSHAHLRFIRETLSSLTLEYDEGYESVD